jgi:hypothetical protein
VRSALILLGMLFLPLSIWFAYANWHRYAGDSIALFLVAAVFLRNGFTRDEDSWIAAIDDLGAPPDKK